MTESVEEFIKRKNEQFIRERYKEISFKHITRKGKFYFKRKDWVFMPQSNLPKKVFVFERLEKIRVDIGDNRGTKIGEEEYRIGYFIVGEIGNRKDKWTWGQFCPLIPIKDFNKLLYLAKNKGVILE